MSSISVKHSLSTIVLSNAYFIESYDGASLVAQVIREKDAQLTAETKRADEAEAEQKRLNQLLLDEMANAAAAEDEVKRLREGIEWLEVDIQRVDAIGILKKIEEWMNFCRALLAQPSDGKEAKDAS